MLILRRRPVVIGLWILGTALAMAWYVYGCSMMWPANKHWSEEWPAKTYDQAYYTKMARQMATNAPPAEDVLPRSRMPVYPWMLQFFYDESRSEVEQFEVYKVFNIILSCLALAGTGWIASRLLGKALGLTIAVITATTFFVFKAVLVQPEVLYYFVYCCLFLTMVRFLRKPGRKLGAGLALLTAVTYFLKGSCLPTIGLFLVLALIQAAIAHVRLRHANAPSPRHVWLPVVVFSGVLLLLMGPYLFRTHQFYGRALYDPNSAIYFWAESPEEMEALQELELSEGKPMLTKRALKNKGVRHFLRTKWLPVKIKRDQLLQQVAIEKSVVLEGQWDILPSSQKWFKKHSLKDAVDRLWNGLFDPEIGLLPRNAWHRNGYFFYLAAFALAAITGLLVTVIQRKKEVFASARRHAFPTIFAVTSIAANLILYAWWSQLSNRNRFFLTQYLPLMFLLGLVIRWTSQRIRWQDFKCPIQELPLPKWLGGISFRQPLLLVLMLIVWIALVDDILRLGRLDKPFFKNNPNRTQAEANLVQ